MLSDVVIDGTTSVKDQLVSGENGSATYTFSNVTSGHTITARFVKSNTAPTTPTVTTSNKTTNSFTVSAVASDVDGDNLTYTLYVGGTSKGSKTAVAGTQVTFDTVTGLSEYTTYSYYVTVTDESETATSSTGSIRTKCSGTGTYKCTASTKIVECSYCFMGFTDDTNYISPECKESNGWVLSSQMATSEPCDRCTSANASYYKFEMPCCNNYTSFNACDWCYQEYEDYFINEFLTNRHKCTNCDGEGKWYVCSNHTSILSNITHCSHGYTSQHD